MERGNAKDKRLIAGNLPFVGSVNESWFLAKNVKETGLELLAITE